MRHPRTPAVSTRVRELRRRMSLTQQDFARVFGVHPLTVSKWERGRLRPDAWRVGMFAHIEHTVAPGNLVAVGMRVRELLHTRGTVAALQYVLT